MEIRLDGRVAVVTGGSAGIGLAAAEAFAEAGGAVAILARRREQLDEARIALEKKGGAGVLALSCDVRDARAIGQACEEVLQRFGKVDILVNNAGSSLRGPFLEMDDAAWEGDLQLKLMAAIRLSRMLLPGMRQRRWGRVLNVLAAIGKAPGATTAPTSVSRAAGLALTKVLSAEFAPDNVLVNAICVGWIESDQWPVFHAREAPQMDYRAFLEKRGQTVPLRRLGKAEEVGALACFLASDAGAYITGTAINIDGGRSPVL
jgi:3-oxoacyl-[acyl-carrier protein] reductase